MKLSGTHMAHTNIISKALKSKPGAKDVAA
jgi:hypothetical protein